MAEGMNPEETFIVWDSSVSIRDNPVCEMEPLFSSWVEFKLRTLFKIKTVNDKTLEYANDAFDNPELKSKLFTIFKDWAIFNKSSSLPQLN